MVHSGMSVIRSAEKTIYARTPAEKVGPLKGIERHAGGAEGREKSSQGQGVETSLLGGVSGVARRSFRVVNDHSPLN